MNFIKETALSVGFDACGIAAANELTEDAVFLQSWLREGNQAEMHYLERNFEKRIDPRVLVPGCKSVVVVLVNYFPDKKQNSSAPQLAKYAYSEIDYHQVLKSKLQELERKIIEKFGKESVSSEYQHLFVDSAPVLERRWAQRAGLGWIGKNTQLIHPNIGSYCFIGVLMLNIEAEYDTPALPHCGNCTRCIESCPTNALTDGKLDAQLCISYQTIENKNAIPVHLQDKLSNCMVGCDICADVCPWNLKWARNHNHAELSPDSEVLDWGKENWQQLSREKFNEKFQNSAVKRAGFEKITETLNYLEQSEK
jgi:epoxyqueuosine reductase